MPVRDLKKLSPMIREALDNTGEDTSSLEKMSDEGLFELYCEWHGLINWSRTLLEVIQCIKESKIQPMWCYHMIPIKDSLLAALNSIPYNGQFVTVQNGQVVYRCEL